MNQLKPKLLELNRSLDGSAYEIDRTINDLFAQTKRSKYKELWERYYNRVSQKNEDERINVEPFFGFDVMYHHMGYRTLMDMGAGIHVSLGVLGTFVGLSVGLAELHIGDTEALRSGISSLLDGMKVAFYTSVWGVLLSLTWTMFDRWISGTLERNIDWHSERLDFLLSTDDEELFLNRLEKLSRSQADHLKTLLTDALEKAMQPIALSLQQSHGSLQRAFGQLHDQFAQLHEGMEAQARLLESQIELTKNTSADVTSRLVDEITGGTQQSIGRFSEFVQQSQVLQAEMMKTIEAFTSRFAHTEERQAMTLERTEKMFAQFEKMAGELELMKESYQKTAGMMNGLGETFYQLQQLTKDQFPIQQEVMRSNQLLAEKYDDLAEQFTRFNAQVETQYSQLLEQLVHASSSLSASFQTMANRFEESLRIQKESLHDSQQLLGDVQSAVAALSPLVPELRETFDRVRELKEQLLDMQEAQKQLLPELVQLRTQTKETVEEALQTTKGYMHEMTEQIEALQQNWATTKEQLSRITDALHLSMKDFAENIDNGLSKTYQHFDETLTKAVQEVSGLVYQFSEVQADFIENLEDLVDHFDKWKAGAST
ncbi:MotA/TolQ/ExbB proton channel family protein [Geobacillus stearothermophilus]|nr:MotA/TolQ/ExbB proton channel family protein [Geobacillus stearothermophilus]